MSDPETKPGPVLVSERRGAVLVLRLNRPEARNALNPELLTAIGLGMAEAESDPDVRAVVLTGTGEKAFCAGMDLRAFAEGGGVGGSPEGMKGFVRFTQGEIGVPIVGAANATAVAGGFELLLGCDVVVASEAASFGLPEVKTGPVRRRGRRVPQHPHPPGRCPGAHADGRPDRCRACPVARTGQPGRPAGRRARRGRGLGRAHRPQRPAGIAGHQGARTHGIDGPREGTFAGGGVAAQGVRQRGRQGGRDRVHREARSRCGRAADRPSP